MLTLYYVVRKIYDNNNHNNQNRYPRKACASEIAEYFGLDLSSVTRAFYKQMIRERRIPLDFSIPEPNAESLAAMNEADAFFASGATARFSTADEAIAALKA